MFEDVRSAWNAYSLAKIDRETPLWNLEGEVTRRLEQLDYALENVERTVAKRDAAAESEPAGDVNGAWGEILFFTEAFYLFAWRLLVILGNREDFEFPGMKGIEARGITMVRNHLIEHPERKSHRQDFSQVFELTPDGSPILKSLGDKDRGLYVNADEVREVLSERLAAASNT